jgi:hypothetical protein
MFLLRIIAYTHTIALLTIGFEASAQRKNDDPKHENHYRKVKAESPEFTIEITEAHSQQEFTLVKMQITNKTDDFLYFKGAEPLLRYEFGEYHPTGGGGLFKGLNIVIDPHSSESQTLKVTGGNNFHVEKFSVLMDGFYRVSANGKVQEGEPFQLPPSVNDFKAGSFSCNLDKIKKETKETSVTFKFQYQGTQMGILQPGKITLKLENGQEYANDNRKERNQLLHSGENGKFNATFHVPGKVTDMQFANMQLIWKSTFSESEMIKLEPLTIDLELDPGLTEGKNK